MDVKLLSFGYLLEPSRYSPPIGFSGLKTILSGKPTGRLFDAKVLHVPTFDGRYAHQTQVSRYELEPKEEFQVILGEMSLESFKGERLRFFTFGGRLKTSVEPEGLYAVLTSDAPLFKLRDDPRGNLLEDELMDLLAEKQVGMAGHENEEYARLSKYTPYQVFLACLVSLQKRGAAIPQGLRQDRIRQLASEIRKGIQIIRDQDGWDGRSPGLEELLSA